MGPTTGDGWLFAEHEAWNDFAQAYDTDLGDFSCVFAVEADPTTTPDAAPASRSRGLRPTRSA